MIIMIIWPGFRHWTLNTPAWIRGGQATVDFQAVRSQQGMEFLITSKNHYNALSLESLTLVLFTIWLSKDP